MWFKTTTLVFYCLFSFLGIKSIVFCDVLHTFSYDNHVYQIYSSKKSWTEAASHAKSLGGYLVHIESSVEQSAIWSAIQSKVATNYTTVMDGGGIAYVWIGATDVSSEGTWLWDGTNSGTGINFWNGQGSAGKGDGSPVSSRYNNWGGTQQYGNPKEPDDYGSNQDAAAIALEPWPKNNGSLGKGGEWNDISISNSLFYVVEYDISGLPEKSTKPTGKIDVCAGENSVEYSTTNTLNALTYKWFLEPPNAGNFSSSSKSVTINWSNSFSGNAELYVISSNSLGEGPASEKLLIKVNPLPSKANRPKGPDKICKEGSLTEFSVEKNAGVDKYKWFLYPNDAGKITGETDKATVEWSKFFTGTARISVSALNDCGIGEQSEASIVSVLEVPVISTTPSGETKVEFNAKNLEYYVISNNNINEYFWKITPEEAGEIISNVTIDGMNRIIVDWNDEYSGNVDITVAGSNNCGKGGYSNPLKVVVDELPGKSEKPVGDDRVCQGTENSEFSTNGTGNSEDYKWSIIPIKAGTISGTGKTALITWSSEFYGTAKVFVQAVGKNGNGLQSDTSELVITPKPLKCSVPKGETKICTEINESVYKDFSAEFADSYEANLNPENAGDLVIKNQEIVVKWNTNFLGNAIISIVGVNSCGKSELPSELEVSISKIPEKPNKPSGASNLIRNSKSVEYSVGESSLVDTCYWKLVPEQSGIMNIKNKNSVLIDLNENFKGQMLLSVSAGNNCGVSNFSEELIIMVDDSLTSISEVILEKVFDIYPNPASNKIFVKIRKEIQSSFVQSEIKLFNSYGIEVISKLKNSYDSGNSMIHEFDVEYLPAGVYMVKIQNQILKFIKL